MTITNTRKPSLKITKTVAGDMGDKTKKFRFTVVLKKADGEALSGDYSYIRMNGEDVQPTDGTLTFNREGAAEFALGHKESLTILNLPVGTVYEIKENAEDSAGYEVTCNAADHGTLFNSKQEVAVTNTRNIIPETGLDDRKDGVLPAAVSLFMAFVGTMFLTSRRRRGSL